MRPEDQNPLDLNNLPDDYYSRDGKQVIEDASSDYCRKKKSGGKDGKKECGKVYECRFCSLKFCKSQALGGHMNRHRQERETETLNHARQLVFRNDHSIVAVQGQVASHLGCCNNVGGDPTMSLRFPRYLSAASSSSSSSQASQSTYLHTSSFASHYPVIDYYMGHGHALQNHSNYVGSSSTRSGESGYTCIGASVGHGGFGGGDDGSLLHSHGYSAPQHRLHPPSVINRFHDGF